MEFKIKKDSFDKKNCLEIKLEENEQVAEVVRDLVKLHHEQGLVRAYITKGKRTYTYDITYYFYHRENTKKWRNALTGMIYNMENPEEREAFIKIKELLSLGIQEQHSLSDEEVNLRIALGKLHQKEQAQVENIKRLEWEADRIAHDLANTKVEHQKIMNEIDSINQKLQQR